MRSLCLFLVLALFATPAWGKSKELSRAVNLYESGQLSQARDQLRLLVDKRHFSERDRIQARLYLAATELALQEPAGAREQLTVLAKEHPKVRPDPAVFSPELVLLSDQIRSQVAQERAAARNAQADAKARARQEREAAAQARAEKQRAAKEAKARAEQQKQLQAQQDAEQQKQLQAQQDAEQQKQLQAQHDAEQQKQLQAQRDAEQQKELQAQGDAEQQKKLQAQGDAEQQKKLQAQRDALRNPKLTVEAHPQNRLTSPAPNEPSGNTGLRTWGYAALGVGAAAAVVGTLFGLAARSAANDAATAGDTQTWQDARDRADRNGSKATAGFVLAGLAATGGVVMVATSF